MNPTSLQSLIVKAYNQGQALEDLTSAEQPSVSVAAAGLGGLNFYENAVTPDALFLYLSTRLQRLDTDITTVFDKQQDAEVIRKALNQIKQELGKLESRDSKPDEQITIDNCVAQAEVQAQIEAIRSVNPNLANRLESDLMTGSKAVFNGSPDEIKKYNTLELNACKESVDSVYKELEASSQLDMIQLQSLMSARQTAIQLSSNLTSSLHDSLKAIVGNMGR